jgi:flagella basal body P-ring formation protein FlgA
MNAFFELWNRHRSTCGASTLESGSSARQPVRVVLGAALGVLLLAGSTFGQLDRLLAPVEMPAVLTVSNPRLSSGGGAGVSAGHLLTGDELLTQLSRKLSLYYKLSGDLRLALVRPWQPMVLPSDDVSISLTQYPEGGMLSVVSVRFQVLSGGRMVGEWEVGLRAQLWREVWVAASRLNRGDALDAGMLVAQKVDVLREGAVIGSDEIDPAGYEMAQGVSMGRPLTKRDICERPVIRKNQVVEVVANRGGMLVSMKAQALQNGGTGALIKMLNIESRREFNAQVLDENRVEVHF